MFQKDILLRWKPFLLFWAVYSLLFWLFSSTLQYTFPFLAGWVLALLLQPLMRLLTEKARLKSGVASAIVTVLVFLLLFGAVFGIGVGLVGELMGLVGRLKEMDLSHITQPVVDWITRLGASLVRIDADFLAENKDQLLSIAQSGVSVATALLTGALRFLTSLPAVLTTILVIIFSTYFFSKDMPRIKQRLFSPFTEDVVSRLGDVWRNGLAMAGRYLSSYAMICLLTFVESLALFLLLGVKYPVVLSIAAGVADLIPVVGPGAVFLPAAVVSLCSGETFAAAGLVVGWILIIVIREIVEPKIISSSVEVHPLLMLAALYVSLIAGNLMVFLYFLFLCVFYQILKKAGVLKPLFAGKEGESTGKRRKERRRCAGKSALSGRM